MKQKTVKVILTLCISAMLLGGCGTSIDTPAVSQEDVTETISDSATDGVPLADEASEQNVDIVDSTDASSSTENTDIPKTVSDLLKNSTSVQDGYDQITALADATEEKRRNAPSQTEMDIYAEDIYTIWSSAYMETSKLLGEESSEDKNKHLSDPNILASVAALFADVENEDYRDGSIFPMLVSTSKADIYKNSTLLLSKQLADSKNESFELPEKSALGRYLNLNDKLMLNEYFIVTENIAEGYDAVLFVDPDIQITGSVEICDNGELKFVSEESGLEATIRYDWNSASFEVTNPGSSSLKAGDSYEFTICL